AGGTLVIASGEQVLPGAELLKLLSEEAVEVATIPPSAMGALPEAPLKEMRTLVFAGEACGEELVAKWSVGRRLVNAYGPTGRTVGAMVWGGLEGGDTPHMGRPIHNTRM